MRGVLTKILHETLLGMVLFSLALLLVEVLLGLVLPQILDQMDEMMARMPFVRDLLGALLGIDIEGEITAQLMQAFVWVHPTVLTLLWANEIMFCTRFPAGEIDRGTIDILLALPLSRRRIYLCETIAFLLGGMMMLGAGAIGYAIGSQSLAVENRPGWSVVALILFNLFCLYVSIGGVAFLVSSISERRGRAVFAVFSVVVASFLINFLAQFWTPAEPFAFLSVVEYYQPANIIRNGTLPAGDIAVLLGIGLVAWLVGREIVARRSICTT
ncbi:MAG: ABC transporter permease subunit [Acidobacteria bacterium]|nr:ABC transporter permease subunit [Acidobacteriota bacterium]NIM61232.1 ABC transporter permease subunit [Acidobacteriota bacterium]NIO59610.1 ABC transporter permease subunit [Acidobacteriota bacterium]NIQ30703.1 ABC transporter permease subunit [Acidobacteriota bacterium]NIQ85676.1 ABC transporter permease subunit [Acidobacteriota bacterium]